MPRNSPVPRRGWFVQQIMTLSESVVFRAMWTLKPTRLPGDQGVLVANASITKVARATKPSLDALYGITCAVAMPHRTVGHCLDRLARKGIIERWGTLAPHSPFGASWRIRRFDEVLARWAADAAIGTTVNRNFYFRGKGRWHLTPAELIDWKLDHTAAEANPAAQGVALADFAEPGIPVTAGKSDDAALDLTAVMTALIDVCGTGDQGDARFIWREALKVSGNHPVPPVDAVADMIRAMGSDWRKTGNRTNPITHGLVKARIGGRIQAWRHNIAAEARAKAEGARVARENRVRSLADMIELLRRGDLPADEHEFYQSQLAAANPDEREDAERSFSRTA